MTVINHFDDGLVPGVDKWAERAIKEDPRLLDHDWLCESIYRNRYGEDCDITQERSGTVRRLRPLAVLLARSGSCTNLLAGLQQQQGPQDKTPIDGIMLLRRKGEPHRRAVAGFERHWGCRRIRQTESDRRQFDNVGGR